MRIAVVGATGFVGTAVSKACVREGHEVSRVRAPRLASTADSSGALRAEAKQVLAEMPELAEAVRGLDAVVNAAGAADAISADTGRLRGANALLPVVLEQACLEASVPRFVHISSVAVQGRIRVLDESGTRRPFSPYSQSKAWAEEALEAVSGPTVIYRPTSVHGPSRRVTSQLARLAASPVSSVAGDGRAPSPQVHIDSVGSAVAHLLEAASPPRIVMHPWEGVTTGDILLWLGGRRPHRIPVPVARGAVSAMMSAGRLHGIAAGTARRLEMMWFGQAQSGSWLTTDGWRTPVGVWDWEALGVATRGSPS